MAEKFCPSCGEVRTMRVHTEHKAAEPNAQRRVYRCEICGQLVEREDVR